MKTLFAALLINAIVFPGRGWAQEWASLKKSLTLYASFDKDLSADYSTSDPQCYFRQSGKHVPAVVNEELALERSEGRSAGYLRFTRKGKSFPSYRGAVVGYNPTSWNASVSVWLKLDPDRDLEPGYCDPVQVVGNDLNKGFVFLEWSKDETPRYFRYAIRPLVSIWNPTGVQWAEIPFEKRPMVQVERAPFSREKWTHVAFTLDHVNDKQAPNSGTLYIDGQKQGSIQNWELTFAWDPATVDVVLGAAYVGGMDEFAVFNRVLSDAEVKMLYSHRGRLPIPTRP